MTLFIVGEVSLYIVIKMARGDLLLSLVTKSTFASILVSSIYHVVVKIVLDFTGCFHFRHPMLVGGTGFSLR